MERRQRRCFFRHEEEEKEDENKEALQRSDESGRGEGPGSRLGFVNHADHHQGGSRGVSAATHWRAQEADRRFARSAPGAFDPWRFLGALAGRKRSIGDLVRVKAVEQTIFRKEAKQMEENMFAVTPAVRAG